ncbi:MFS transporter [Mycolicibacterium aichiense]|uniref:MFS transporter n=1 Tax=Mycolicibacterium aichiense TaxID=1799 RepID=A0AAD1MF87_9MYCO|nr:MFS transporter [Mycolicibacterium aichiense]MCV7016271.1 MFS transporter [Mycolicibacterium aichiense]BBX09964.1 MFS transporter [Mycolicibacterium aichiense]STZ26372.1 arabinose efflux permease family protein [Mycolicibacterium aichiense]
MRHRWLALGVLSLGVLLIGVDGTVLAVAAPVFGRDLGMTSTEIMWIGDIYSFVLAGLLVTMGSLGDRIGHKKLLLCSATGFALASVAAAFAPTAGMLIAARALLGVAGASLAPSTLALIRGLFPIPRERAVAVGIWASVFSAGTALGPVIGGLCLEHFWWGAVFLINVPVVILLVIGGWLLLPELRNPTPGPWDPIGAGLSLVGILGVVYAVKQGAAHGLHAEIVAAGLVGAVSLTLFVRRQLKAQHPLIDVRLFANRGFCGVITANMLSILGLSGVLFFLSQFFQLVDGYSPLQAGLAELPAGVAATAFGVLAGVAVRHWSRRAVLTTALAMIGVALASLTLISPATPYWPLGIALFVIGAGLGLAFTVANDLVIASVPPQRAGAAAGVSETAYELGMALGIALLGSVIAAVYRGLDRPPGIHDDVVAHAEQSLAAAHRAAETLGGTEAHALLTAAQHAFADGVAVAAGIGAALLLASAVAVWMLLKPPPELPLVPYGCSDFKEGPVPQ